MERLVINKKELQKTLDIGHNTALRLLNRADFPSFRVGRRWLISKTGLEEWVEKNWTEKMKMAR